MVVRDQLLFVELSLELPLIGISWLSGVGHAFITPLLSSATNQRRHSDGTGLHGLNVPWVFVPCLAGTLVHLGPLEWLSGILLSCRALLHASAPGGI